MIHGCGLAASQMPGGPAGLPKNDYSQAPGSRLKRRMISRQAIYQFSVNYRNGLFRISKEDTGKILAIPTKPFCLLAAEAPSAGFFPKLIHRLCA
jgi:hypothetical protein